MMETTKPVWRIPLADVDLGPEEEAAVLDVLRRGWLSMGEVTAAFEAEFAALTGAKHALAVTNCTAALHLAGLALGWEPGDEVIVPSLTFVATANAITYRGAIPHFVDSDTPTLGVDPVRLDAYLNEIARVEGGTVTIVCGDRRPDVPEERVLPLRLSRQGVRVTG